MNCRSHFQVLSSRFVFTFGAGFMVRDSGFGRLRTREHRTPNTEHRTL